MTMSSPCLAQKGAIHIISGILSLLGLALFWLLVYWQRELDQAHYEIKSLQQKTEMLEMKCKLIELKLSAQPEKEL